MVERKIECGHQIGGKDGRPYLCELKETIAYIDPNYAERALDVTKKTTGVYTGCKFESMGRHCYHEDD